MGIVASADIPIIGEVNKAASSPEMRRDLFQRINQRHDLGAFKILYSLYFGGVWARAFHPRERRVMQDVVGEAVARILSAEGENAKTAIAIMLEDEEPPPIEVLKLLLCWLGDPRLHEQRELRKLASIALLRFLPPHRDFYEIGLGMTNALDTEKDPEILANIRKLLTVSNLRYERDQAESEPE